MKLCCSNRADLVPNSYLIWLLLVSPWIATTQGIAAGGQSLSTLASDVQRVFNETKDAVVRVESEDEHGKLAGTGFLVDPVGTIYTAYAVAGESYNITVEFGSSKYPAERLVADSVSGIAILKVQALDLKTPWIPLGNSDEVQTAVPIVTIGYPMDLPTTPNFGMVGGLDQTYQRQVFPTPLIRANVTIQRGEVGSPLLNLRGEAVGILLFYVDNRTACYALPIKAAQKVYTDFVRFGGVRRGWVGVSVENTDQPQHQSRALITHVVAESPAAEAGIEPGDVLLQVGENVIRSFEDVAKVSFFLSADEKVPIKVCRGGNELTLDVTPSVPRRVEGFIPYAPGYPASRDSVLRLKLEDE